MKNQVTNWLVKHWVNIHKMVDIPLKEHCCSEKFTQYTNI